MRPDRIVIGECRGAEALDMLQAMNTGHAGSMTTAHANTTHDMMLRLETMVLQAGEKLPVSAVRQQIVGAIDLIVQLNRLGKGRFVTDVAEVVGVDPNDGSVIVESIYRLLEDEEEDGAPRSFFTGYLPSFAEEILSVDADPAHEPPVLFA
jgi:pilus assembly protein CpaF